jgi:hypothetical protein
MYEPSKLLSLELLQNVVWGVHVPRTLSSCASWEIIVSIITPLVKAYFPLLSTGYPSI